MTSVAQEAARGLAAGKLSGVFDIAENVVSIFALGPISEGTARLLARGRLREGATGPVEPTMARPLGFELTEGSNQRLSVDVSPDPQLGCVLKRIEKDQKQQVALFRLLWHLSGVSSGVRLEGTSITPTSPVEAHLSLQVIGGSSSIGVRFLGCRFVDNASGELQGRLARDAVLQQLFSALLAPQNGAANSNVFVAVLKWSPNTAWTLDLGSSYVYIRSD